ncbi:MAG: hypothetical protein HY673_14705 [Chloroflexi bacterium]|nr:hypothetical protein [Chloroflexota bacterium]
MVSPGQTPLTCNNEMTPVEVRQFCSTDAASQSLLRTAIKPMSLSTPAFNRVLKLSRRPCKNRTHVLISPQKYLRNHPKKNWTISFLWYRITLGAHRRNK